LDRVNPHIILSSLMKKIYLASAGRSSSRKKYSITLSLMLP
jgi:hypothetical protein